MKERFRKMREGIEKYIPMTLSSLLLFVFVLYLIFNVSRSVFDNYKSNKEIDKEAVKLIELQSEIQDLSNEINYEKTYSFKEKEAREKLGYKAPGENVLSLPVDTIEDHVSDTSLAPAKVRQPNYRLWWKYFFGQNK